MRLDTRQGVNRRESHLVDLICPSQMDEDSDKVDRKAELDDILSQIADLDKWREIFNARG